MKILIYTVGFHERDFLAGESILADIEAAINHSRRMIMIISMFVHDNISLLPPECASLVISCVGFHANIVSLFIIIPELLFETWLMLGGFQ